MGIDYSKDIERWKEEIIKTSVHLVDELDRPKYKGQKRMIKMLKHVIRFNQRAIANPFMGRMEEAINRSMFGDTLLNTENYVDPFTFKQPIDSVDVT